MSGIDNNRSNITLPGAVSDEIWAKTLEGSAALALARHIELPGTGITVPIVTGDPVANWVGETAKAGISNSTFDTKVITPYKMSVIEPVSKEFARDYAKLFDYMVERLPYSISSKLDATIFAKAGTPGSGFDTLDSIDTQDLASDIYQGFVAANGAISAAGYRANGIALDPNGETLLYASVDDVKRPLFVPTVHDQYIGTVLGRPVSVFRNVGCAGSAAVEADAQNNIAAQDAVPNTVGFMGDWSRAIAGIVKGITLDITDKATLDDGNGGLIHLWQQDMVAVKATFECGFAIEDKDAFVRLTTPYSA